jgi:hypothetical protein
MEIDYNVRSESRTMSESVLGLYESTYKIISVHCKLNQIAMGKMQSMGYNGFKRWHRYRSRQFFEMKLCLANELFDKFRINPTFKEYELTYSPTSMEDHLKSWNEAIFNGIKELGTLNKEYYELTGMNNCIIEKILCKMVRDYEKIGRYLKRFSESDWLTLDMHTVDDKLHEKFKQKEMKYGFNY